MTTTTAYDRCEDCMRLTFDKEARRCIRDDCRDQADAIVEDRASFALAVNGYRLTSALAVYSITHEDPEGWWEGNTICDLWTGGLAELYRSLKAHGFPVHRDKILCPTCLNADVLDLGDHCEPCLRNLIAEYGH